LAARAEALAARAEALAARAEASSRLARAAEADAHREQAERESAQARAETRDALIKASIAEVRREQAEHDLAEVSGRSLRLESTLREVVVTLSSLRKTGLLPGMRRRFREWRHVKLIRSSALFDAGWYVRQYPEVVTYGLDPAYDFLWNAAPLGRNPGPGFDSNCYLLQHSDVAQRRMNPLLHYILFGAAEGRQIRPAEYQPTGHPRK